MLVDKKGNAGTADEAILLICSLRGYIQKGERIGKCNVETQLSSPCTGQLTSINNMRKTRSGGYLQQQKHNSVG